MIVGCSYCRSSFCTISSNRTQWWGSAHSTCQIAQSVRRKCRCYCSKRWVSFQRRAWWGRWLDWLVSTLSFRCQISIYPAIACCLVCFGRPPAQNNLCSVRACNEQFEDRVLWSYLRLSQQTRSKTSLGQFSAGIACCWSDIGQTDLSTSLQRERFDPR